MVDDVASKAQAKWCSLKQFQDGEREVPSCPTPPTQTPKQQLLAQAQIEQPIATPAAAVE